MKPISDDKKSKPNIRKKSLNNNVNSKFFKLQKMVCKAKKIIPGGTNTGAIERISNGSYEGCPINAPSFIKSGKGAYVVDLTGKRFIDYILGYGPVILGHACEDVNGAVIRQVQKGTLFAANTEDELRLSKKIIHNVPCAEQVLLTNTGSCAASIALRLSRAFTKRQKVLKFEGHYHGWHDWNMVGNSTQVIGSFANLSSQKSISCDGVAQSVYNDVLVIPWNEPSLLEETIATYGDEIAAVFAEGYQANFGVIPPEKGFLELIRKLTKNNGIVFVLDEVITGFRMGLGGAQKVFGVTPDLAIFSKAMANGYPIAAVAGKKTLMDPITYEKTWITGTFNANAVSVAASLSTISKLESDPSYNKLYSTGNQLIKGIQDAFQDLHIPGIVQGPGPFWSVFFTEKEKILNSREIYATPFYPHIKRSAKFFEGLLERGVYCDPSRFGRMYNSFAHDSDCINNTLQAINDAMKEAATIAPS